jgi:polysaccharide deacetylase family protein (PEP-CTERM system associated)
VTNAFTVDVEDWFHVCGMTGTLAEEHWDRLPSRIERTTDDLLRLLDRCSVRATFFVLGWIAERHPALIQRIARAGHEVGSHGFSHRRVYELTPEAFADELARTRAVLAAAGATEVIGFRAPEWSINDRSLWALDVLADEKFVYDSSMTPLKLIGNPAYPQQPHVRRTRAGEIAEFPPFVVRRFGQHMPMGGGWGLRMSRPATVTREIAERNEAGNPVVLFVHPWEIDDEPPRMTLPLGHRFAHYFRLRGFRDRLETILRSTRFAPVRDVLANLPDIRPS